MLLSISLSASSLIDSKILTFEKKRLSANKRIEVLDVSIHLKKETNMKGWYGYVFNIKANVNGQTINAKDIVFTNGEVIAPELIGYNGKSLKDNMTPELSSKYYNKEHLIAGNPKGKNKVVIFSDALCPFCLDLVPEIIKHVKKYPKNTALYYYHFPLLRLHPAAGPIAKAMDVATAKGVKDVALKIYEADFEQYFPADEKDIQKILDGVNKVLSTKITKADIEKVSYHEDVKMGEDAMVQGTPTIYINGKIDNTRLKYESLK